VRVRKLAPRVRLLDDGANLPGFNHLGERIENGENFLDVVHELYVMVGRAPPVPACSSTPQSWVLTNLLRPLPSLGGVTPAEAAGVSVPQAGNRWVALIREALETSDA
jgi:hypothetical protein